MVRITQYYIRTFRPRFNAVLSRILYAGRVKIGKNFRTDSVPRIMVDKGSRVVIGDNVEFRRNIEIRVHQNSKVIIGSGSRIDRSVRFLATNQSVIELGEGTRVGLNSVFNGGDNITVGKKCLISGFVYLQTSMHGYANQIVAVQDQGFSHAAISLQDDCWLGTHVVVLPGIKIEKGGIVGSNAVVNKDVKAFQIVAGIPAKPIKERES